MSMDEVIDTVVASCDGNLRGPVMALLLVNERWKPSLGIFARWRCIKRQVYSRRSKPSTNRRGLHSQPVRRAIH
jgi:hypothetical protein